MAQARSARAIHRKEKNSVRNLRYGPQTRLVRGMSSEINTTNLTKAFVFFGISRSTVLWVLQSSMAMLLLWHIW